LSKYNHRISARLEQRRALISFDSAEKLGSVGVAAKRSRLQRHPHNAQMTGSENGSRPQSRQRTSLTMNDIVSIGCILIHIFHEGFCVARWMAPHSTTTLSKIRDGGIMIRQFRCEDENGWRSLWTQYLACDGSVLDGAIHDGTWTRLLEGKLMHGSLAFAGSEAVGLVHYLFHPSTWSLNDTCYLQDLFVTPEMRGRGIGRALIAHVCAEASAAGLSRVYWQTQADNQTAIALYETVAERSGYIQFRSQIG